MNTVLKNFTSTDFKSIKSEMLFPLLPEFTATKPSQYLEKTPAYIFHHLIKCGGTSVAFALKNWFSMKFDHLVNLSDIDHYVNNRCSIDNLISDTCIVGHYEYEKTNVNVRYPEIFTRSRELKTFMFIRDPLKFVISFYYYTSSQGRLQNIRLTDYIDSNRNLLAYFLNCDESNFKNVLDRYFFIGIVELMQESLDKLADILGKKRVMVPVLNTSAKDRQMTEINQSFIENFKADNKLDYMIYDYCLEKFYKL